MGHSQRLRLRDIRDAERVVNEACELWADPGAWQAHVVTRLGRLLHGPLTMWVHAHDLPAAREPRILAAAGGNQMGDKVAASVADMQAHGWAVHMPEYSDLARRYCRCGVFRGTTYRRQDLVSDLAYHASPAYQRWLGPADIEGHIASIHRLSDGTTSVLGIHRTGGERPYTVRERRLTKLLHATLAPHVGTRLALAGQRSMHGLSCRQRQTLDCLLAGDSEKQAAARLGIRPRTLHEYTVAVYRHFDVAKPGGVACLLPPPPAVARWVGVRPRGVAAGAGLISARRGGIVGGMGMTSTANTAPLAPVTAGRRGARRVAVDGELRQRRRTAADVGARQLPRRRGRRAGAERVRR